MRPRYEFFLVTLGEKCVSQPPPPLFWPHMYIHIWGQKRGDGVMKRIFHQGSPKNSYLGRIELLENNFYIPEITWIRCVQICTFRGEKRNKVPILFIKNIFSFGFQGPTKNLFFSKKYFPKNQTGHVWTGWVERFPHIFDFWFNSSTPLTYGPPKVGVSGASHSYWIFFWNVVEIGSPGSGASRNSANGCARNA